MTFYDTRTLEEIEDEMSFAEVKIPDDESELGNIPELLKIPMYSDTSPEEDEYVSMSDQLTNSIADMTSYNKEFEKLNEEIEKYRETLNKKIEDFNMASTVEFDINESNSNLNNHNQIENTDQSIAVKIPEFSDSSPDDQEYRELKADFVEKYNKFNRQINDEFNYVTETRKKRKTQNQLTTSQALKKSAYGAPIQSNSFKAIVNSAQKQINKVTTALQNHDKDDYYQSFRDEICDDDCKDDCNSNMKSRVPIK